MHDPLESPRDLGCERLSGIKKKKGTLDEMPSSWERGLVEFSQQSSSVCVLGVSYQLVYAVCLVVQCLRDLRGPD